MRSRLQVWMAAFLFTFTSAFIPSGGLFAQQAAGAPLSEIDQLTGPIALYPDAIVIQILTASKNYDTLKSFAGWLEQNANLKGSELQDAAQKAGFSEALVALAPFPQVVQMMVEKPDWTKALGQAVTADKKARLRFDPAAARAGAGPRQPENHAAAGRDRHQCRSSKKRSSSRSWS